MAPTAAAPVPSLRRDPAPASVAATGAFYYDRSGGRRVSFETMGDNASPPCLREGRSRSDRADAAPSAQAPAPAADPPAAALTVALRAWTREYEATHGRPPSVEATMEAVQAALR